MTVAIMMTNLCLVSCKTMAGQTCVFPFTYNGTQHYDCITHDNDGTPWCASGDGEYDNCMPDCTGTIMMTICI